MWEEEDSLENLEPHSTLQDTRLDAPENKLSGYSDKFDNPMHAESLLFRDCKVRMVSLDFVCHFICWCLSSQNGRNHVDPMFFSYQAVVNMDNVAQKISVLLARIKEDLHTAEASSPTGLSCWLSRETLTCIQHLTLASSARIFLMTQRKSSFHRSPALEHAQVAPACNTNFCHKAQVQSLPHALDRDGLLRQIVCTIACEWQLLITCLADEGPVLMFVDELPDEEDAHKRWLQRSKQP
jgi:hypothetical protein